MSATNIKKTYLIQGMTCSGCERAIQRAVSNVQGVASAKADLQSATVSVEYDPQEITVEEIKSAVNKIGYKVIGERPSFGQKPGRDDAVS